MDRPTRLGAVGGVLTAVSMLLGYFGPPVSAGARQDAVGYEALLVLVREPLSYHAVVLFVPAAFGTFGGVLLARTLRSSDEDPVEGDLSVVVANLAVPAVTVYACMVGSVLLVATAGVGSSPVTGSVVGAVLFWLVAGLVVGSVLAFFVAVAVMAAVVPGSVVGYAVARGVGRTWRALRR
jgi:hypothetical protein